MQGYGILNLFLLANLVTTTSSIPILLGLWRGKGAKYLVTSFTVLSGCVISFFSLIVYSAIRKGGWGVSMSQAVHTVFFEAYDYPSFVIALGEPPPSEARMPNARHACSGISGGSDQAPC